MICVRAFEAKLLQVMGDSLYKSNEDVVGADNTDIPYVDDDVPLIPDTTDLTNVEEELVSVYIAKSDEVVFIELREYLCGVLRGEMQPTYHIEALKAQSVAAYTYLVYQAINNYDVKKDAHQGAVICTDPSHCKAYLSESDARHSWGDEWYDKYDDKIKAVVESTLHEVVVYQEEVINAVFFSISSGMTEDAESVWGYPIPYLVSVSSEFDTGANGYASEKRVSISDFKETLENNYDCDFSSNDTLITNINRSGAGGIISVTGGGSCLPVHDRDGMRQNVLPPHCFPRLRFQAEGNPVHIEH
jgi:stage II sporulation protein D